MTPKDALTAALSELRAEAEGIAGRLNELGEALSEATRAHLRGDTDAAVRALSRANTLEHDVLGDCRVGPELAERLGLSEALDSYEDHNMDQLLELEPGTELPELPELPQEPAPTASSSCPACDVEAGRTHVEGELPSHEPSSSACRFHGRPG